MGQSKVEVFGNGKEGEWWMYLGTFYLAVVEEMV